LHGGIRLGNKSHLGYIARYFTSHNLLTGANYRFGRLKNTFFVETLANFDIKEFNDSTYTLATGGNFMFKKKYNVDLGFKFIFDNKGRLLSVYPTYNFNVGL
jgi:hypothetical protein